MAETQTLNARISENVRAVIEVLRERSPGQRLTNAEIAAGMARHMPLPVAKSAGREKRAEAEVRLRNRIRVALGDYLSQPPRRCWRADYLDAFATFAGIDASELTTDLSGQPPGRNALVQLAGHLGEATTEQLVRLAMAGRDRPAWAPVMTLLELLMRAKGTAEALEICHTVIALHPDVWPPRTDGRLVRARHDKHRSKARRK